MTEKYRLELVPENGPTLSARTKEEWRLGYRFKVLFSDLPAFTQNKRYGPMVITIEDVQERERCHPIKFKLKFETLTTKQFFAQQAEVNHAYAEALQAMEDVL